MTQDTKTTKDLAKAIEGDRELALKELDAVSGGINPQPLPPSHERD